MASVEQRVEFRGIVEHDGFKPSFRGAAIQSVIGVGGQRVAMQIELMQQALKGSRIRGAELLRGISHAEKCALPRPARELHAVKYQRDFVCGGGHAALNRARACGKLRADARDCFACGAQCGLELIARHQPTFPIPGISGINLLHGRVRLAHFVNLGTHGCSKREQAFAQALAASLRHEKTQALDGAALGAEASSAQACEPSCMMPRTWEPENEFSRSGAAVSESTIASGTFPRGYARSGREIARA